MAIETAVNIDVNVDGTSTVQQAANAYEDLGDAVSKTQLEAERLAHQFGINDARTQEAIRTAGKYKSEMEQLDFAIEGAKGGTQQLFKASQAVVGGFEAAVGAAALFGGESEELEQALIKVQGAMALSQGLADFKEFSPALLNLIGLVRGKLVAAFKFATSSIKGAFISTGIGALVVGIGIAIEAMISYSDEVERTIEKEEELAKERRKNQLALLDENQKQFEQMLELRLLREKSEGKSEAQLYQTKIKLLQDYKMAWLKIYSDENATQAQRAKAFEMFNEYDKRLTNEKLNREIQLVEKRKENRQKEADDEKNKLDKQAEDQKRRDDELLKRQEELAKKRELLGEDEFKKREILAEREFNAMVEGFEKSDQAYKDAEAIRDATINQINVDREQKRKEEQQKRLDDFNKEVEEQVALQEYLAQIDEENRQNRIDALNEQVAEEAALQEYLAQIDEENKQAEIEREQAVQDAKNAIFDESVKLGDAIIALAGESSKVGKAIALAQIGADTARALSGALANANSPTPDNVATGGLAGIAKYIALATTILSNAKRAYNIIKAPAPSAGSTPSRPSAPGVPQMAAPRLGGVLNPDNEITQQRKVYVVESDITSTQAKVSNTQKVSLVE